jgi:hypothetical protein
MYQCTGMLAVARIRQESGIFRPTEAELETGVDKAKPCCVYHSH